MKKQLLIAAVAATMGTAAIADISITGNMKANYTNKDTNGTNTNKNSHEANLVIAGTSGSTKVHVELALDSGSDDTGTSGSEVRSEDVWLSTEIAGVTAKMGTWNGSDSILSKDATRAATDTSDKFALSGSISGVDITVEGAGDNKSTATTIATTISGVKVSYKNESTQDQFKASGSISGLNYAIHALNSDTADSDKNSVEVSYVTNGVTLSAAKAGTDTDATISGDAYFGDVVNYQVGVAAGDNIQGFGVKTDLAGTTVQAKFITVEDYSTSADQDIIKLIATRKLAAGTTFEVTYTDQDNVGTTNDSTTIDFELGVKF
jgi:hypothetical protein